VPKNPWLKESARRPLSISREAYDLRWDLAFGKITKKEFDREYKKVKDLPPPKKMCD
jgi:hypothetical protein